MKFVNFVDVRREGRAAEENNQLVDTKEGEVERMLWKRRVVDLTRIRCLGGKGTSLGRFPKRSTSLVFGTRDPTDRLG